MSTNKDFDEVFAEGDDKSKHTENPAIAMRAQRQADEDKQRDEFLSAFDKDTPEAHPDEPAQAAVAAAADVAAAGTAEASAAQPAADDKKAEDKAKDKDKK